ncbi:hypothetical protein HMPREF9441_03831 [Paraprevotella clara YIT 11840]|uniref:Uncharacterized protein n=1 Tax=Paraprevotella clara YIT 11840 TaxID=762968 RepID=G5SWQ8_9BACT|nr:hypothetical protein HMPREF9441_03831 [Paraprevotella clara YIT 11840]
MQEGFTPVKAWHIRKDYRLGVSFRICYYRVCLKFLYFKDVRFRYSFGAKMYFLQNKPEQVR